MKYKIISLVLISFATFSFSVDAKSNTNTKNPTVEKENKTDFRKTLWGMSFLQVQATEKNNPENFSDTFLLYKDKIFGTETDVEYYFSENKLIKGIYVFNQINKSEDYIVFYKKIKETITEKYGRAISDNSAEMMVSDSQYKYMADLVFNGSNSYETNWDLPKTKIILSFSKKNVFNSARLELAYLSKKYLNPDTIKKQKKTIIKKEVDSSKF